MDVDAMLAERFALISPHLTKEQRRRLLGRALAAGEQDGPHQRDGLEGWSQGAQHPDRDGQFRYLNKQARARFGRRAAGRRRRHGLYDLGGWAPPPAGRLPQSRRYSTFALSPLT